MAIYSREQIRERAKAALRTQSVACPEFGEDCEIVLRQLRGGELVRYQRALNEHEKAGTEGDAAIALIQLSAVDEAGDPLWPGDEGIADIEALPSEVLTRLIVAATELNSVDEKSVEEAAGN